MRKHGYIFCLNGEFVITSAFDKSEAYMNARLMGYDGSINDIRLYEQ